MVTAIINIQVTFFIVYSFKMSGFVECNQLECKCHLNSILNNEKVKEAQSSIFNILRMKHWGEVDTLDFRCSLFMTTLSMWKESGNTAIYYPDKECNYSGKGNISYFNLFGIFSKCSEMAEHKWKLEFKIFHSN